MAARWVSARFGALVFTILAAAWLVWRNDGFVAGRMTDTTIAILASGTVSWVHACPGYRFVSQPHRISPHSCLAIPLEREGVARRARPTLVVVLDLANRRVAWPTSYSKPLSLADRATMLNSMHSEPSIYVDWYDDRVTLTLFEDPLHACGPWVPLRLDRSSDDSQNRRNEEQLP